MLTYQRCYHIYLQGVQAQTLANFYLAFELDLPIIPVINKIDLKSANPEAVVQQMLTLFDIQRDQVIKVSEMLLLPIFQLFLSKVL